jgi:aerobic carbon-monoxide dehydrogenase medium subunit
VAHADPASDLPTVLTALGGRFVVSGGGGTKTVEAQDFFKGMMTTALDEHDLLVSIEVPMKQKGQGSAYVKFTHPASRYAVIGAAAVVTLNNGMCTAASVAVGGLVARPVRAAAVEKALIGQAPSADAIARAAGQVAQDLGGDIIGDLYASAEYRKAVAPVWVKRALTAAADRAR